MKKINLYFLFCIITFVWSCTDLETPKYGKLIVFSKFNLYCGPILVTVDDRLSDYITHYSLSTPDCDSDGSANFSMETGTYLYKAECDGKKWSGYVNIKENICSKINLIE